MMASNRRQSPPTQKCPRCDSDNTKFCYYNNYSLSQPRYFCKACRRYWTHGGTLRNVPVGGGFRKSKRAKPSSSSQSLTSLTPGQLTGTSPPAILPAANDSSFLSGSNVLSSLTAMQSLPTRLYRGPVMNLSGGSYLGPNMPLLHGPQILRAQNEHLPSWSSMMIPPRPLNSWGPSFVSSGPNAPGVGSSFWSGSSAGGDTSSFMDQAGPSLGPNQWCDSHLDFDPSKQA